MLTLINNTTKEVKKLTYFDFGIQKRKTMFFKEFILLLQLNNYKHLLKAEVLQWLKSDQKGEWA